MMEGASPRRADRLFIVIFALIGAVLGFFGFIAYIDPVNPVSIVVFKYPLPGPHPDATLTVTFFGRVGYTRSAPDPAAFQTEVVFWQFAPLIVVILGGALGGGLVGDLVGRGLPRARYGR